MSSNHEFKPEDRATLALESELQTVDRRADKILRYGTTIERNLISRPRSTRSPATSPRGREFDLTERCGY